MLDNSLIKTHSIGRDGYVWWVGQVASEESWKDNKPPNPQESNDDIMGFGERYRVAIIGYTPFETQEVTDDELYWAYVEYPVTAGSGGRGSSQSANLAQGDFVRGYFLDGEEGQIPIISAVIGKNEYQAIVKNRPQQVRFVSYSGFLPDDYVPYYTQKIEKGGEVIFASETEENGGEQSVPGTQTGKSNNEVLAESVTGSSSTIDAASEAASQEPTQPLAVPSDCEPIPLGKIQQEIKNVVVEIQKIQKSIYDYSQAVQTQIGDIQNKINSALDKAAKFVASGIKWIFTQIQKFVIKTTNNALKKTYSLLFPNERPALKVAVENINDLIACLFKKLIGQLLSMIGNFLEQSANKVINGVECLVENLIGNILGKLISSISDIINGALSSITSLIGQATDIVGEVLGIITDVLSFLTCEEKPQCSSVNEWNILSGASKVSAGSIDSIVDKAKNIAASFQDSVENVGDSIDNAFDMNMDDVFNQTGCDIGPAFCGPPQSQFFGSGTGAAGNLIIGSLGEVIGIDMVSFGVGYDENSYSKVYDNCGKGTGAYIRPIISNYTDSEGNQQTGGITDVEIISPGTGYLPAPDGSRGGNEYTWSDPEDTVINYPDGTWLPIPPGEVVSVVPDITVITPPNTVVVTEPLPGQGGDGTGGDGGTGTGPNVPERIILIPPITEGDGTGGDSIGGGGLIPAPGPGEGGGTGTTPGQGGIPGTGTGGDGTGGGGGGIPGPGAGGGIPGTGGGGVPGFGPGEVIVVEPGQGGGGGGEIIRGGNDYLVRLPGLFTTPKPDYSRVSGDYPTSSTGSYPVILYLCEIYIDQSGINYTPGDNIVIEPDLGAIAEPKFDRQGRVYSIKVTQSGEGFTEYPRVYIESETGYNAVLRPKLCIDRVGNDELKEPEFQDKIITVIDCVGKV